MAGEIPNPHSQLPEVPQINRLGSATEAIEGNEYTGRFTGQGFIYQVQHEPLGPTLTFFSSISKSDFEQAERERDQRTTSGDLSAELPLGQELDLGDMMPNEWTDAEVEYDITVKVRKIRDAVVEEPVETSIDHSDTTNTSYSSKPKTVFQRVRNNIDGFWQRRAFEAYARQQPASYSGLVRMIRAYETKEQGAPVSLLENQTGLFPLEMQKRLADLQEAGLVMMEGEAVRLKP